MELIDQDNNLITLFDEDKGDPATVCQSWASSLKGSGSGTIEQQTGTPWGGLSVAALKLTTFNEKVGEDEIYYFNCAKKGDVVFVLASVTWVKQDASVRAATDAVKASWVWK